jgi:23S rRNA (pseudouridine1915-N3)-methyltransferase
VVGGADGIDSVLRARADAALSFGAMVWPHMLVRVMLAEQLYRAATILSGGPYHRI